jgi:hypothetical protein
MHLHVHMIDNDMTTLITANETVDALTSEFDMSNKWLHRYSYDESINVSVRTVQ